MFDLQKANILKRISAFMFDIIMLVIAVIGAAFLLSSILDYDGLSGQLEAKYAQYESTYGIALDLTAEEIEALDEAGRAQLEQAREALSKDTEALRLYSTMFNYTLIIASFSVLIAYLLLELLVPLLFGNGQTLGKKIFGIGVMREDGVKITPVMLFIRTVLGKYTVETMIPIMVLILLFFGVMGVFGIAVLGILMTLEVAVLIGGATRPMLHDKMARTVCVDIASQMIFDTEADLIAYKQRLHEERVQKTDY